MPRFRLDIEYDGSAFVGWQRQDNGLSVQQVIEDAIPAFTGERVGLSVAGRTDAGVHALGQVAHFDLVRDFDAEKIASALNYHMRPHAVAILAATHVGEDFHARFSATRRHYRYRILNRVAPPVIERNRVWHQPHALDHVGMDRAAKRLLGHHDFTSFRAAQCQAKSPVKTLDRLDVMRYGDEIIVEASARSFLHNQVRAMVGSLKLVGDGRWSEQDLVAALEARDRQAAGPNAPPEGLYLTAVDYTPMPSS